MYGPTLRTPRWRSRSAVSTSPLAGTAARARDQAGTQVADLGFVQPGIGDRVAHGQVGIGRGIAHEALELAIDQRVQVELDRAADPAAQANPRRDRAGSAGRSGLRATKRTPVSRSLPRQLVMPMPVMTTRRMLRSPRWK